MLITALETNKQETLNGLRWLVTYENPGVGVEQKELLPDAMVAMAESIHPQNTLFLKWWY